MFEGDPEYSHLLQDHLARMAEEHADDVRRALEDDEDFDPLAPSPNLLDPVRTCGRVAPGTPPRMLPMPEITRDEVATWPTSPGSTSTTPSSTTSRRSSR